MIILNGINKTDIYGIKIQSFDTTLPKVKCAKGTPYWEAQTSPFYLPQFKIRIFKGLEKKPH